MVMSYRWVRGDLHQLSWHPNHPVSIETWAPLCRIVWYGHVVYTAEYGNHSTCDLQNISQTNSCFVILAQNQNPLSQREMPCAWQVSYFPFWPMSLSSKLGSISRSQHCRHCLSVLAEAAVVSLLVAGRDESHNCSLWDLQRHPKRVCVTRVWDSDG